MGRPAPHAPLAKVEEEQARRWFKTAVSVLMPCADRSDYPWVMHRLGLRRQVQNLIATREAQGVPASAIAAEIRSLLEDEGLEHLFTSIETIHRNLDALDGRST
jgi:hypothetical protein